MAIRIVIDGREKSHFGQGQARGSCQPFHSSTAITSLMKPRDQLAQVSPRGSDHKPHVGNTLSQAELGTTFGNI